MLLKEGEAWLSRCTVTCGPTGRAEGVGAGQAPGDGWRLSHSWFRDITSTTRWSTCSSGGDSVMTPLGWWVGRGAGFIHVYCESLSIKYFCNIVVSEMFVPLALITGIMQFWNIKWNFITLGNFLLCGGRRDQTGTFFTGQFLDNGSDAKLVVQMAHGSFEIHLWITT